MQLVTGVLAAIAIAFVAMNWSTVTDHSISHNDAVHQQEQQWALEGEEEVWEGAEAEAEKLVQDGDKLHQQGDTHAAMDAYIAAIEHDDQNFDAFFKLGSLQMHMKEYEGAVQSFSQATSIKPKQVEVWRFLGEALRLKEDLDSSVLAYARAIENDRRRVEKKNKKASKKGREPTHKQDSALFFDFGSVLLANRMLDQAATAFWESTELEPRRAQAWHGLGVVLSKQRRYKASMSALIQAESLDMDDVNIAVELCTVYWKVGKVMEAAKKLEILIERFPEEPFPRLRLAQILMDAEDWDRIPPAVKSAEEIAAEFDHQSKVEVTVMNWMVARRALDWNLVEKTEKALSRYLSRQDDRLLLVKAGFYPNLASSAADKSVSRSDLREYSKLWWEENFSFWRDDAASRGPRHYDSAFADAVSVEQTRPVRLAYLVNIASPDAQRSQLAASRIFRLHHRLIKDQQHHHGKAKFSVCLITYGAKPDPRDQVGGPFSEEALANDELGPITNDMCFVHIDKEKDGYPDYLAMKLTDAQIDVMIDVNGYVEPTALPTLAYGTSPVQVRLFGDPDPTLSGVVDYFVTDRATSPENVLEADEVTVDRGSLAAEDGTPLVTRRMEKPAYLPKLFFPQQLRASPRDFKEKLRSELLPPNLLQGGCTVFGSFVGPENLSRRIAESWTQILRQANSDGRCAVLWLVGFPSVAQSKLKTVAGDQKARIAFTSEDQLRASEVITAAFGDTEGATWIQHQMIWANGLDVYLDQLGKPNNVGREATVGEALRMWLPAVCSNYDDNRGATERLLNSFLEPFQQAGLVSTSDEDYVARALLLTDERTRVEEQRKFGQIAADSSLFDDQRYTSELHELLVDLYKKWNQSEKDESGAL